jgi:hypothetical protein
MPAETPSETRNGFVWGLAGATEILVVLDAVPVLRAAGRPSVIPGPVRVVAGASSAVAPAVGWSDGNG